MAFNISYIYQAIDRFTAPARKIKKSVQRITLEMTKSKEAAKKLSASLATLGKRTLQVATVGIGFAIREFVKFETALLGVAKTANIKVGPELDKFGEEFVELSKRIPVSAKELLSFGQSAAQLGVRGKKNILGFAEVMAKLTRTTNIAGEEGASQLARLIKITGGSTAQVSNFASALVDLGNTTAATEGEILEFATRLASSGALFGITGVQALGLAATLKAVGIRSEEGGSSIGRGLGAINKAILGGGEKLVALSKLTGIASKDLKKAFGADAIGVLTKFSLGLDKFVTKGGDATQALAFFGLEGIRDLRTLGLLAKNTDLLTEKMKQSAKAFKENIALEKEFSIQTKSLGTKFILLANNFRNLGRKFVLFIKPAIEAVIAGFIKMINVVLMLGGSVRKLTNMFLDLLIFEHVMDFLKVGFESLRLIIDLLVVGFKQLGETFSNLIPNFGIALTLSKAIFRHFTGGLFDFGGVDLKERAAALEDFSKFVREKGTTFNFSGVAAQERKSQVRLDGNININAPAGVINSVDAKISGASAGNLGLNLAGAR